MEIRKLHRQDAAALQECRLLGLRESPESLLLTYEEAADTPLSQLEAELAQEDIHWLGAFDGDGMRTSEVREASSAVTCHSRSCSAWLKASGCVTAISKACR